MSTYTLAKLLYIYPPRGAGYLSAPTCYTMVAHTDTYATYTHTHTQYTGLNRILQLRKVAAWVVIQSPSIHIIGTSGVRPGGVKEEGGGEAEIYYVCPRSADRTQTHTHIHINVHMYMSNIFAYVTLRVHIYFVNTCIRKHIMHLIYVLTNEYIA